MDEDSKAEEAYAILQKQIGLDQWESDRLVSLPLSGYEKNPEDWIQDEDDDGEEDEAFNDEDVFMETIDEPPPPSTKKPRNISTPSLRTPRRALQRANTPVMRNTAANLPDPSIHLTSPWPQRQIVLQSNPSLASKSSHLEFKRYYDALVHFKVSGQDDVFLRTLNSACWERDSEMATLEGNFWRLLSCLHLVDPSCVLWEPRPSTTDLQALALQHQSLTHARIIDILWDSAADLPLQRRRAILQWLEICFHHALPHDAMRVLPNNRKLSAANPLREALNMYDMEHDGVLFRSAFALILAGRLDDAKDLAESYGSSWRATMWGGGTPHGFVFHDDGYTSFGNPNRPLWRSRLFDMAEESLEDANLGAIYALLSSNFKKAIDNEALRSWDKGLYAAFKCSLDRTEDLLLYHLNSVRRNANPPFPGTEHHDLERQHLDNTRDIADMDEKTAVGTIKAAPFESMHPNDVISDTICRFIVGKDTLKELFDECIRYLKEISMSQQFEPLLRFMTHVAVYLDMKCNTNEFTPYKDELILMYLNHLSSREDLWYMNVLYATFLPYQSMLERLPPLLVDSEMQSERKQAISELKQFLPEDSVVDVLRATVDLSLSESDEFEDSVAPTGTDKYKMRSLYWLCSERGHMAEALMAANTLLRYFLLQGNKEASATTLAEDHLPSGFENTVKELQVKFDNALVENALLEFSSFTTYLNGMSKYRVWKKAMEKESEPVPANDLKLVDQTKLTGFAKDIAKSQLSRNSVESKRELCEKLVKAADTAQQGLMEILNHPGGLLSTVDDTLVEGEDQRVRRLELAKLRLALIPKTIRLYYDVCSETATCLFRHLDELAVKLSEESSPAHALREIDFSDDDDYALIEHSSVSPLLWAQRAIELFAKVQDDTFGLRTNLYVGEFIGELHTLKRRALSLREQYKYSMSSTSAS